jgi:hypothetical protein
MSSTAYPAEAPRRSAGQIVLLVFGVIVTLIALGLVAGGAALVWAHAAKRDSQGYFTTSSERFATDSFAIATDSLDVANDGPNWLFEPGRLATIRIRATSNRPIFVGIAHASDVKSFLAGASYARVTNIDYHPFHADYTAVNGTSVPGKPSASGIWVAAASGAGTPALTWDFRSGKWSVVVMNANGGRGVIADVSVGAKISWLIWVAVGLVVGGMLALFAGGLMIFFGARAPARRTAAADT